VIALFQLWDDDAVKPANVHIVAAMLKVLAEPPPK
jgi:hypothetical protein